MTIQRSRPLYCEIKRKIMTGGFPLGRPIGIKALEQEFSSSAIPVREVLIEMATEDLIDFVPNRGFFTKPPDASDVVASLELMQFFLVDAARYMAASRIRRDILSQEVESYILDIRRASISSMFDRVKQACSIFTEHYRQPHADFLNILTSKCAYVLYIDGIVHNSNVNIEKASCFYFMAVVRGNVDRLEQTIGAFVEERCDRITNTLAHLSHAHRLLS